MSLPSGDVCEAGAKGRRGLLSSSHTITCTRLIFCMHHFSLPMLLATDAWWDPGKSPPWQAIMNRHVFCSLDIDQQVSIPTGHTSATYSFPGLPHCPSPTSTVPEIPAKSERISVPCRATGKENVDSQQPFKGTQESTCSP